MTHKTTAASGYLWRLLIIGIVGVGYAGWAVYDATINYPAKQELRETYEFEVSKVAPDEKPARWAEYARANGHEIVEPKSISEKDILTQWILFAIAFPVGAYHLVQWTRWRGRFIEGDDDGVRAHGGRAFTWDQVTAVDAAKWARKGIAYIDYDADGSKGLLVIDDWKYDREPADAIFDLLKDIVDEEKISGLTPDAPAEAAEGAAEV